MTTPGQFAAGPPPYLKDRYRLVKWIGAGSMGVVYRAQDETLGREAAIKFPCYRQAPNLPKSGKFNLELSAYGAG